MSVSPLHYRVDCMMCTGSLIVESDSLEEIFQLLRDHLNIETKEHEKQSAMKPELGKRPVTNQEIFDSLWLRWSVSGMQPFQKIISQVVNQDLKSLQVKLLETPYAS